MYTDDQYTNNTTHSPVNYDSYGSSTVDSLEAINPKSLDNGIMIVDNDSNNSDKCSKQNKLRGSLVGHIMTDSEVAKDTKLKKIRIETCLKNGQTFVTTH